MKEAKGNKTSDNQEGRVVKTPRVISTTPAFISFNRPPIQEPPGALNKQGEVIGIHIAKLLEDLKVQVPKC